MNESEQNADTPEVASSLHEADMPIRDRNGKPMNVGDSFRYQVGTQFESTASLVERSGRVWVTWTDGTPDILLADFWYGPGDEPMSEVNGHIDPSSATADAERTKGGQP